MLITESIIKKGRVEYLPLVPILRRATLVCSRVCCSMAREALMPHLEKGEVLILKDGNTKAEQRVSISQIQLPLHSERWLDR